RLEVLPHNRQLAPRIELDDVPREHPDVDDVANTSGLPVPVPDVLQHVDLLGPDREAPAVALDDVRHADESGDELGRGTLVDVGGRAELLDPSFVEDRDAV